MVEFIITGNPQREEKYDYPLEATREIVINMIVHRDYRGSRKTSGYYTKVSLENTECKTQRRER